MMPNEPVAASAGDDSDAGTQPPSEVDVETRSPKAGEFSDAPGVGIALGKPTQLAYNSVLNMPQWDSTTVSQTDFHNLTPWVTTVFFIHSYFCYIYVFFMIVFSYYKSYALEHPEWRKWCEILLLITLPALHHARFFFGHWACHLGFPIDMAIYLSLCPLVTAVLIYFRFNQMYILPLEHTLLFIALYLVILEAFSGVINALQVLKIMQCDPLSRFAVGMGILCSLAAFVVLIMLELSPQMYEEDYSWMSARASGLAGLFLGHTNLRSAT